MTNTMITHTVRPRLNATVYKLILYSKCVML